MGGKGEGERKTRAFLCFLLLFFSSAAFLVGFSIKIGNQGEEVSASDSFDYFPQVSKSNGLAVRWKRYLWRRGL